MNEPSQVGEDWGIQILSDIHLEFFREFDQTCQLPPPLNDLPVCAPVLALLGDIGIPALPLYKNFISDVSGKFELVILISGNHEYYSGVVHEVDEEIRRIVSEFDNVKYLQKSSTEYRGILFLGATLWTDIPLGPPEDYIQYWYRVNDFRQIKLYDESGKIVRLMEPRDYSEMHRKDRTWLTENISKGAKDGKKMCVFTHHAPLGTNTQCPDMRLGGVNHSLKRIDFSNLSDVINDFSTHVLLWGFGHTHHSSCQILSNTQIVSNCLGYIKKGDFDPFFAANFVVYPNDAKKLDAERGHYEIPGWNFCILL